MTLTVRQLEREDFDAFLKLSRVMWQECEPMFTFSDELLLTHMFRCINAPIRYELNGFVAYRNKNLIGMAVGTIDSGFYSPDLRASMHYWYVLPQYRKTRAAAELLRIYERWSREHGAVHLHLGAERTGATETDAINAMIARRGFIKYGEQFYKELREQKGHEHG